MLHPRAPLDPTGALAFLAETIAEASASAATAAPTSEPLLLVNYDRYGGAEMEVAAAAAGASVGRIENALAQAVRVLGV